MIFQRSEKSGASHDGTGARERSRTYIDFIWWMIGVGILIFLYANFEICRDEACGKRQVYGPYLSGGKR